MRPLLVTLHRYVGLTIAGFLIVAGLTGALLSWDRELDGWINRDLNQRTSIGDTLSVQQLIALVEAREPRASVTFIPLSIEPGYNVRFTVRPRIDPHTGQPFVLPYTHVFVDPMTGAELGRRDGDGETLSWRSLVPFLIRFHYSLHLPMARGVDVGLWLMGAVALVWLVHSLAAIFLTFPRSRRVRPRAADALSAGPMATPSQRDWWSRWKPSWRVRWRGGSNVVNFDLHRASALWTWPLLLILAFTASSQNLLPEAAADPIPVKALPQAARAQPTLNFEETAAIARAEAVRLGWNEPAATASYDQEENTYNIYFFEPGEGLGNADIGGKTIYVGGEGRVLGHRTRWEGDLGDVYLKLQFPIHSMRILGLPGRILISLLGMLVAGLSITGVVIWARKRRFR